MLTAASAHSYHRIERHPSHRSAPVTYSSWFGLRVREAPHRPTRGSWSSRDADEQAQRSIDDANQRARDDANSLQQQMLNNQ
jgi:hypothetical protein